MVEYANYHGFIVKFLLTVMEKGFAVIICNYEDYGGLLASLNEHTIAGQSLALTGDCAEAIDDDITVAKMNSGNMMISVFNDGTIVGEPILFETPSAFPEGTYFIEADATDAMALPLIGTKIQFGIKRGLEF